jgi:glycosyltransferase involved in cell wall biosynthesis
MRILVLSTWFPYPTYQGSKNRAYYLIRGLARKHELALVSYEDVPLQPEWIEHMRSICARVDVVPRRPFDFPTSGRLRGWLSLKPSAAVAGYAPEMADCVAEVADAWQPDAVFALTYITAPYALQVNAPARIFDLDNLHSVMLHEAYQQAAGPAERLRRYLAYWKFRRYEHDLIRRFDLSLVTSIRDEQFLYATFPPARNRLVVIPNGVDLQANRMESPTFDADRLIFTGALTYEPNLDAMRFFLGEVLPLIQAEAPETRLWITGKTEGVPLHTIPPNPNLNFTGFLDDIRPALRGSAVCVVPLRRGGGTRLKILEAMANGVPVVSTTKGAEGLQLEPEQHLLIADRPDEFARQTLRLLRDPALRQALVSRAYQRVQACYDWDQIGERFCRQVEAVVRAQ